jgi:hypothetical protein
MEQGRGTWADQWCLTGYEYRMCTKLIKLMVKVRSGAKLSSGEWTGWIDRYCADISSAQLYGPQDYVRFKPWNRFSYGLQTCARRWQTSTWSQLGQSRGLDSRRTLFGWLAGRLRLIAAGDPSRLTVVRRGYL